MYDVYWIANAEEQTRNLMDPECEGVPFSLRGVNDGDLVRRRLILATRS